MHPTTFAKAIVPLVLGVVSVILQWTATGEFNEAEFSTSLTALITAIVVYLVPNKPTV